jgi:hypothetical protein
VTIFDLGPKDLSRLTGEIKFSTRQGDIVASWNYGRLGLVPMAQESEIRYSDVKRISESVISDSRPVERFICRYGGGASLHPTKWNLFQLNHRHCTKCT